MAVIAFADDRFNFDPVAADALKEPFVGKYRDVDERFLEFPGLSESGYCEGDERKNNDGKFHGFASEGDWINRRRERAICSICF